MSSTPPRPNTEHDPTAVITAYFAERLAAARAEAERASVVLAEAERAAAAFADRQELPPAVGAMKQGWELAAWSTERASRIGYDVTNGKASIDQYHQAKAERAAVLAWLDANGYEVPGPYKN